MAGTDAEAMNDRVVTAIVSGLIPPGSFGYCRTEAGEPIRVFNVGRKQPTKGALVTATLVDDVFVIFTGRKKRP